MVRLVRILPYLLMTSLLLVPGSEHSSPLQAQPVISSVSPNMVFIAAGKILLNVRGINFDSLSTIRVNGVDRSTTFTSSSELGTLLLDSDTAATGSISISVFSPSGAAGVSSSAMLLNVVSRTESADRFPFVMPALGATSFQTSGTAATAAVGYARIRPDSGQTSPMGFVIFSYRQNGVLVSEASVPASTPLTSARIYVENAERLKTGIAIANSSAQPSVISYSLTDSSGTNIGQGSLTIPAGNQIAKFLDEAPFNAPASMQGTISMSASVPVGMIALRALVNERNDFLMTTLPVTDLSLAAVSAPVIVPHFADGGGWKTHLLLVNPTEQSINGSVQFMGQGASSAASPPLRVTISGQTASAFNYSIAPRSSVRLSTTGAEAVPNAGWIRVSPSAASTTPSVLGVFSFRNGAIITTEAGVSGVRAGTSFRVYAESSADNGGNRAVETGIAIANTGTSAVTLNLELLSMSGAPTGLHDTASVPAQGQIALFLNQITGLASRQATQGILRVSTDSPSAAIAVVGLRGRYNERGDFLITSTPPIDESEPSSTSERLFPHIVDGGGYTSQFVVLSGPGGTTGNGLVQMLSQIGGAINLKGEAPPSEPAPPCSMASSYTDSIGDVFGAPQAAPLDSHGNAIMPGANTFTGQGTLPAGSFNSGPNDVVNHTISADRGAVTSLYPNLSPSSPSLYLYMNNPENPCGPPSIGGETPDEPSESDIPEVTGEEQLNQLADELTAKLALDVPERELPRIPTTGGVPPGPCDPIAQWNAKRCDLRGGPLQGRDIIFVNGLMPDALTDVVTGHQLPIWPDQQADFLTPGGYWWTATIKYWQQHIGHFFVQPAGRKNRYMLVAYPTTQRLSVGRHAMLTQIDMAMKTGFGVVNPDAGDPRGRNGFCYAGCVVISHSTGALLTDLTLATAADPALAGIFGGVSYIPDFIKLHVTLGGAMSGSAFATAGLVATNGLDQNGTPFCLMMNLFLDRPLFSACPATAILNQSVMVDLVPLVSQSKWGPVMGTAPAGKTPIPTLSVASGNHDNYWILKRWLIMGLDDGVVNMDSACGKSVPSTRWPSGFKPVHPALNTISAISPLVYDKGIDGIDAISAGSRATRFFREQTYEHLLNPGAVFPPRVGGACTPYLSSWGMVEPLDYLVAVPPAASPVNFYPNHYPFVQTAETHNALKVGDQAKFEDTLATSGRGVNIMNNNGGLGLADHAIEDLVHEEVRGLNISFWLPINVSVGTGSCPAQPPAAPNKWCVRIGAFKVTYNKDWHSWWVWKRTYHRFLNWGQTEAAEYVYRYALPNPEAPALAGRVP